MSLSSGIELVLLQIITVFACQVAMGTRRLQHYIQWLGKGICYVVVYHFLESSCNLYLSVTGR